VKPRKVVNKEQFGRVAVVMGGLSAEKEISINSGTAVFNALERQGVDVIATDVGGNPIEGLSGKDIDRVFNMIHGRGGEDGVLQAVLESMGLPYTGSGVLASALTMDKLRTKLCWRGAGLPTPNWFVLKDENDIDPCIAEIGFPMIVKPALEGSSIGMSKANNKAELQRALIVASEFQSEVYAEAWVNGSEYTVAMLNGEMLPIIRLQTPNEFYDFEAKYRSDNTLYHCPCGLTQAEEEDLTKLAKNACDVVGISGWGRVDVFIDEIGNAQLIEVNTVPGMTDHSLVPMAAKAKGMAFDELVWRILETSLVK